MKLLLAALAILPASARLLAHQRDLEKGFGVVIPHRDLDLCLWVSDGGRNIAELRTCPTDAQIEADQYDEA